MALTTKDPKDTYLDLLQLENSNAGLPAVTPQTVYDGAGNASLLALSQAEIEFTGLLSATVASGIVVDTGVDFTADAVIVDSVLDKTDTDVGLFFTSGDPEGSLTADVGSMATRRDGTAGATFYIKESGTGNTGWQVYDVVTDFIDLNDTPGTYSSDQYVKVNSGGTALEYGGPPTPAFFDLTDVDPTTYVGQGTKLVGVNATVDGLDFIDRTWLALTDTDPTNYTGSAGYVVRVNATPDGLEFHDLEFTDLTNTPVSYGTGDDVLASNAGSSTIWRTMDYLLETVGSGATANQWLVRDNGDTDFVWEDKKAVNCTDIPDYTGEGDKYLKVNAGGTAFEYAAAATPGTHASTHQDGGGDEISIAGLDGEPATLTTHKDLTTGVHGAGGNTIEHTGNKGAVSGYASLNGSTKVVEQPAAITDHLEDTPSDSETTKAPTSNWAYDHAAATGNVHGAGGNTIEHTGNKGAASGYASLNGSTKVVEQPAAITDHLEDTPSDSETTKAPTSNWAYDHDNSTAEHGATGAVVGTTNTQTLTNKTLQLDDEPITMIVHDLGGSGLSKGDVCFISGDESGTPDAQLAKADAAGTCSGMIVVINETISSSGTGAAVVFGWVTGFSSLTPGAVQYISNSTAGDMTETPPSTSTHYIRKIAYAMSATEIFVNTSQYLEQVS